MIAALLLQAAPAAPPPWTPVERANAATGARAVSASATSADGAGRLVVRCDRGAAAVISIQYIPRERPTIGQVQPVSLAFDGGTAMGDNWERMGNGLIERGDVAAATLYMGIAHAREIRLRTTDANGAAVELSFAGPANEAPIRRVVEACGVTFGGAPAAAAPALVVRPDPR